jgi:hypothetical protein
MMPLATRTKENEAVLVAALPVVRKARAAGFVAVDLKTPDGKTWSFEITAEGKIDPNDFDFWPGSAKLCGNARRVKA